MANNPYVNKVVFGAVTIIDISDTTATASDVAQGKDFYTASGEKVTGTATGGGSAITVIDTPDSHGGTIKEIVAVDISSDTVTAAHLETGYTAHDAQGNAITGTLTPSVAPTLQTITKTYTPTESQQTETITAGTGYDGIEEVDVTVNAVSSTYVGTGVARKAAATITPTESQQTIAADQYLTGAQTIAAIPSNYVGTGVTQRASSDLTASGATVTAPAGYYASAATKTVASGSATPAASISATGATVSTGTNTLTLSKTVSNTPQVSAGYVSAGTAGNSSVSLTASVTTQAAQTIHPSASQQTIASGRYLTGTQTINAVTTTNLTADNIKSGVTVQIGDSSDSDCVMSVTGTYSGGGSSDVVMGTLNVASNVNTSTSTTITTTGTIGFTPTKFFFWKDSRTATSNHVHQATFTTIGSYYIRTMTRYSSNALSTSGNTNNWTTQTAGYLYYSSSTIYFRSSSSYILSAGTWYWVAVK